VINVWYIGDFNGWKFKTTSMASEQEAAGVEVEGEVNSEETSVMSRDSRLGAFIQSLIEKRGLLLNERKWQGSYTESSVLDAGRRSIQGLRFEECHLLTQSINCWDQYLCRLF